MYLPELPWINLTFKARCPSCHETIGSHIVKDRFTCPSCKKTLTSNKDEAINKAIMIGLVLYAALFIVINAISIDQWLIIVVAAVGSTIPIVAGIGYFKIKFKVSIENNDTP